MVSKSGLALEALLRGPDDLLLLDEPDNSLDVPGKRWLEEQLRATDKGVLYVSHDRELLDREDDRGQHVCAQQQLAHHHHSPSPLLQSD